MKVKELIEKLQKLPDDAPVYFSWENSEGYTKTTSVREYFTEYPTEYYLENGDVHTVDVEGVILSPIVILD